MVFSPLRRNKSNRCRPLMISTSPFNRFHAMTGPIPRRSTLPSNRSPRTTPVSGSASSLKLGTSFDSFSFDTGNSTTGTLVISERWTSSCATTFNSSSLSRASILPRSAPRAFFFGAGFAAFFADSSTPPARTSNPPSVATTLPPRIFPAFLAFVRAVLALASVAKGFPSALRSTNPDGLDADAKRAGSLLASMAAASVVRLRNTSAVRCAMNSNSALRSGFESPRPLIAFAKNFRSARRILRTADVASALPITASLICPENSASSTIMRIISAPRTNSDASAASAFIDREEK